MKISEYIKKLEEIKELEGDLSIIKLTDRGFKKLHCLPKRIERMKEEIIPYSNRYSISEYKICRKGEDGRKYLILE